MKELAPTNLDFGTLPPIQGSSTFAAEWWLAMSHLRSKKQEAFLSLVSVLAILGVVVGVAALNMVIAVMAGFEEDLRDKILGANAHIVVLSYDGPVMEPEKTLKAIQSVPGVTAAAPFIYTEAMVRTPARATGIILKGLDPELTGEVTQVRADLVAGPRGPISDAAGDEEQADQQRREIFASMAAPHLAPGTDASDPEADPLPGILVGEELTKVLLVSVGDKVQVIDPIGGGTGPMGVPTPKIRQFRIAGIFRSGMFEYDTKWTYVANADAQAFLGIGQAVTGIEMKVDDVDGVVEKSAELTTLLKYPYYTRHWKELNQDLFEALELEKVVMGMILSLIVVVAALLIVTTLIMIVITRGREIAILKAMGASRRSILRIFVIQGSVIGLIGTLVGTVVGLLGCWFLDWYGYPLKTDVYILSNLPVVVQPENVIVIAISAFLICFVATLYPAARAAALDPIEGLRYE